jgi:DNA-binding response OmpR family regulator
MSKSVLPDKTFTSPKVSIKNKTIFIVEDDVIIAKLLKHTLNRRGFQVIIAENGQDAIENLENTEPPNLILLDIILPYFDGFEVLKKIRQRKDWNKVPIVMLTSKTQETSVVRAFDYGADDYVTKPFQIEELIVRINRLMR